MKIQGKTLIERVIERVSKSKYVTKIIVATSKHNTDIPLRKLCFKKKIECYAGNLASVAHRFCEVLKNAKKHHYNFDVFRFLIKKMNFRFSQKSKF